MQTDNDKRIFELSFVTRFTSGRYEYRQLYHEYWKAHVQPSLALVQAHFDYLHVTTRATVSDLVVMPVNVSLDTSRIKIATEV